MTPKQKPHLHTTDTSTGKILVYVYLGLKRITHKEENLVVAEECPSNARLQDIVSVLNSWGNQREPANSPLEPGIWFLGKKE